MAKSVPVEARISPALKQKLEALVKATGRSESALVAEAIERYIEVDEWQVRVIKKHLDDVLAGEPGIPHEEVARWIDSMGTGHELPRPKPPRLK